MSRLTKIVKETDLCCLSRKLLTTLKCGQIPLTIFDPNKVRSFYERFDQWDFYNREREMQRRSEEAKSKIHLKAHSKFTMNLLPDYSHLLQQKKNEQNAKTQAYNEERPNRRANYAKLGGSDADKGHRQLDSKANNDQCRSCYCNVRKSGRGSSRSRRRDSSRGRLRIQRNESKKRKNNSKKRNNSIKGTNIDLDSKCENPLGKNLDYVTTEEYKRISPELLNLLQEEQIMGKQRTALTNTTGKVGEFIKFGSISNINDSLDVKNPKFADYLRKQMEDGSIMNKLYNIDFYNKKMDDDLFDALNSSQSPYKNMNLHELKELLKILLSGGKLTEDQLKYILDFLKTAAGMDPDSFAKFMEFCLNLGLMDAKMIDFLKSLLMQVDSDFSLDKLIDILKPYEVEETPPLIYNYELAMEDIDANPDSKPPDSKEDMTHHFHLPKLNQKHITTIKSVPPNSKEVKPHHFHLPKRNIQHDEPTKKHKKGYVYPEKIRKHSKDEVSSKDKQESIPGLGPRPDIKNNYFDFRIEHTIKHKPHPIYYEPLKISSKRTSKKIKKSSF